jgi:hypothetical protein
MELPFTTQDEWRWRWMQFPNQTDVLHRVKEFLKKDEDWVGVVEALTVCDLTAERLVMPGIFSRMGAPRCKNCCKKLKIPDGDGAPFNQKIEEPGSI